MEVAPTPDPDPPSTDPQVVWQLLSLEGKVEALSERLGRLEASMRDAVGEEVRGATAELRRAISELGRRLVQDLPHELARHRDAIVAELRPPPPPPPPPPPAPPPPEPEEPAVDELPESAPEVVARASDTPEAAARRRASRLRRRQG